MKHRLRRAANWTLVLLLSLVFGGIMAYGIVEGQMGEVLFNATLV